MRVCGFFPPLPLPLLPVPIPHSEHVEARNGGLPGALYLDVVVCPRGATVGGGSVLRAADGVRHPGYLGPGGRAGGGGFAGDVAQAEIPDGETKGAIGPLTSPADGVALAGEVERVDVLEVEVVDDPDVSRQPLQTAGWSQEALVLAGVVLSHLQSEFSTSHLSQRQCYRV